MNEKELLEKCAAFGEDLDIIKQKHGIVDIICHNWDNEEMGYVQLHKMIKGESEGLVFVMSFSHKGDSLCACCRERRSGIS